MCALSPSPSSSGQTEPQNTLHYYELSRVLLHMARRRVCITTTRQVQANTRRSTSQHAFASDRPLHPNDLRGTDTSPSHSSPGQAQQTQLHRLQYSHLRLSGLLAPALHSPSSSARRFAPPWLSRSRGCVEPYPPPPPPPPPAALPPPPLELPPRSCPPRSPAAPPLAAPSGARARPRSTSLAVMSRCTSTGLLRGKAQG